MPGRPDRPVTQSRVVYWRASESRRRLHAASSFVPDHGGSRAVADGRRRRAAAGQTSAGAGTLSGTVTADAGEVRALRVKARNTATRTAYTVFTVKGRYQIHNLPAGPYQVQVVEEAFESPVQKVELAASQTATANIGVKQHAAFARGAGNAGSIAQTSYGATPQDAVGSQPGGACRLRHPLSAQSRPGPDGPALLPLPRGVGVARTSS